MSDRFEESPMPPELKALRQLAVIAEGVPANRAGLTLVADTLRTAVRAERVCFVYAEDSDWITCGDSLGGDDAGTGRIGLWIVQQQAQTQGAPVAFNIKERHVGDFEPAAGASGREYAAMRIPVSESPAEMVILRGPWKKGIDRALVGHLEASRPCLVTFLERMSNAARAERDREQMYALANAAEVLTREDEPREALASIASAMSSSTGFDLVTIVLWDEATQKLGPRIVIIKKGEHGSLLVSHDDLFVMPAYPTEKVVDPTGCGDSFAGGTLGYLAARGRCDRAALRAAIARGSVIGSFVIESFSIDALARVTVADVEQRLNVLREMARFE